MPVCPKGHDSQALDWCDVCGAPIAGVGRQGSATPLGTRRSIDALDASDPCPVCDTSPIGRFCEACGYDFFLGRPAPVPLPSASIPPPTWVAIVTADASYAERESGNPERVGLPVSHVERRITLTGNRVRIGRRSASRGIVPEIDLSGPPEDAAVSHQHAELLVQPDGSWAIADFGSRNGTYLNDDTEPIPRDRLVPIAAGDRIHVGAWTIITVDQARGA